jgi:hypothetical protein
MFKFISSFEIDPAKTTDGEHLKANQMALSSLANIYLSAIFESVDHCPRYESPSLSFHLLAITSHARMFRELCNFLKGEVVKKFPPHGNATVGGFVFLRFFVPAIVSPPATLFELKGTSSLSPLNLYLKISQMPRTNTEGGWYWFQRCCKTCQTEWILAQKKTIWLH